MTIEEKMREEFEEWWSQVWPDMTSVTKSKAERIWKSSRESLVIELPTGEQFEPMGISVRIGYDSAIADCRESIHAAGVKTK